MDSASNSFFGNDCMLTGEAVLEQGAAMSVVMARIRMRSYIGSLFPVTRMQNGGSCMRTETHE